MAVTGIGLTPRSAPFGFVEQRFNSIDNSYAPDQMVMRHVVADRNVILYNLFPTS